MNSRRYFLAALGLATGAMARGAQGDDRLTRRPFGKNGQTLPVIGLDGREIAHGPEEKTERMIEAAVAAGMTFFDTSMNHMDGRSERRYGNLLVSSYRNRIFLQSRTMSRTRAVAASNVNLSLARLKTDYLDSFLMECAITGPVDDQIEVPPPEVFEALLEARKAGKVRHIGFRTTSDTKLAQQLLDRYGSSIDLIMVPFELPATDALILKAQAGGVGLIADVDKTMQKKWDSDQGDAFKYPDHLTSWVLALNNPNEMKTFATRARRLTEDQS